MPTVYNSCMVASQLDLQRGAPSSMSSKVDSDRNSGAKVEVGQPHSTQGQKRNLQTSVRLEPSRTSQQRQTQKLMAAQPQQVDRNLIWPQVKRWLAIAQNGNLSIRPSAPPWVAWTETTV
ncbi:uncharacterized protein LOC134289543 [Aedes albopictus]|uniref:Secreted protein n=1 Tax=Aedes albopictus TaxID=7160 RepID=A0ABM1YZ65_AEDAL